MCKFYHLEKTDFEFELLDQSSEFKECFDFVFLNGLILFFVFKKEIKKKKNIKSNVKEFYTKKGYKKIKFLNQY